MKPIRQSIITLFIAAAIAIPSHSATRRMNILVYPFENLGAKELAWISAGMTDTVVSDLQRVKSVNVITEEGRKKAVEELELAQAGLFGDARIAKVGSLAGADVIFTGTYQRSGRLIRVNARLVTVATGVIEKSIKIDGTIDGIFDLQDKIVLGLLAETKNAPAGVEPPRLDDAARADITGKKRPALTAYEYYAKGLAVRDANPNEALALFEKAVAADPAYAEALVRAGYTAGVILNRFDRAISYLTRAEKTLAGRGESNAPAFASLLNTMGTVADSRGDLARALEYFNRSKVLRDRLGLARTSGYAALVANIGNIFYRQERHADALAQYNAALALMDALGLSGTADYAMLLMNIGNCLKDTGRLGEAIARYSKALAHFDSRGIRNVSYANVLANMGLALQQSGTADPALDAFRKARDIRDRLSLRNTVEYAYLLNNIGITHHGRGDLKQAGDNYRAAQALYETLGQMKTKDYADLLVNMGHLAGDNKQLDAALENYLKAKAIRESLNLTRNPIYANLLLNIGSSYYQKRNFAAAIEAMERSRATLESIGRTTGESYGGVLFNLAVIYEAAGQKAKAGAFYRQSYDIMAKAGVKGEILERALTGARRLGK